MPVAVLSVYPSTPVSCPASSVVGPSLSARCGASDAGEFTYALRWIEP